MEMKRDGRPADAASPMLASGSLFRRQPADLSEGDLSGGKETSLHENVF